MIGVRCAGNIVEDMAEVYLPRLLPRETPPRAPSRTRPSSREPSVTSPGFVACCISSVEISTLVPCIAVSDIAGSRTVTEDPCVASPGISTVTCASAELDTLVDIEFGLLSLDMGVLLCAISVSRLSRRLIGIAEISLTGTRRAKSRLLVIVWF